jgi:hypothetical protein
MSGTTKDAVERLSPYAIDGGRDAYGAMEADTFGDYVAWEDYLALAAERDAERAEVARVTQERDALREALSLIAVVGYSDNPAVNAAIAKQTVTQSRATLRALEQEADHDKD